MKRIILAITTLSFLVISVNAQNKPVFHFSFDDIRVERKTVEMIRGETYVPKEVFAYLKESVSGKEFDLEGKYYKSVKGVKGNAALLDGYTAYVEIFDDFDENRWDDDEETEIINIPQIKESFTIDMWVALGAYPKNNCPLVDHLRDIADGYYTGYAFGIDAHGRLYSKVCTHGVEENIVNKERIPLNTWTHVACTYSHETGVTMYINGELVENRKLNAKFTPAIDELVGETTMLMGKSRLPSRPVGTIRPEGTGKSFTFFDGILDELNIYEEALTAKEIKAAFDALKTDAAPELPERILPSGPQSPGVFRAVNATLEYYEGWDAPWAVDDNEDIVVQFDESDCKFVFWRGTSYIPNWVTENNIWFNNGFNEGWNDHGSCEPMSDKKTKYSSVKVIESNDARVVVQWRYGLVDVMGTFAFEDPTTGWGDWTNETYYIYPDMSGVRKDVILSNAPRAAHEWQESILVLGPGQKPEDCYEYGAVTVGNHKVESKTYSWEHDLPPHSSEDFDQGNIQIINTKSEYKPYSAVRLQDFEMMDFYSGEEIRREVSVFPWWNHWPVAPRPTDGRYAMYADRAAHSSVSHWFWKEYEFTDRSVTKIMLNGMTNGKVEDLVPMVKGWSNPAEVIIDNGTIIYDPAQKAFEIDLKEDVSELKITISANSDSPVVNPAFVVNGWGSSMPGKIELNGQEIEVGKDLRIGFRESLYATDMVVWMRYETEKKVEFSFSK